VRHGAWSSPGRDFLLRVSEGSSADIGSEICPLYNPDGHNSTSGERIQFIILALSEGLRLDEAMNDLDPRNRSVWLAASRPDGAPIRLVVHGNMVSRALSDRKDRTRSRPAEHLLEDIDAHEYGSMPT